MTETIHGSLVNVYGIGVLIRGESGVGKSEALLDLIARGHALVADDAVELQRIATVLYGSAPETLKGLIEIRGIGICDVRTLYGDDAFANRCGIGVSIELTNERETAAMEPLSPLSQQIEILGVELDHFVIADARIRSVATLIESVVRLVRSGGRSAEMELIAKYNSSLAG